MEDIGPVDHGQGSEIATEGPPTDGDPVEVERREGVCHCVQAGDLVVEDRSGEVIADGPLPGRVARGSASIDDDHGKTLVGKPLRLTEGAPGGGRR